MKNTENNHVSSEAESGRFCVLVLGMHRSGTSALTKVFSSLGCDLPKNLMAENTANEKGYWESTAVQELNDEILISAGSRWDDWLSFNKGWYSSPKVSAFKERALRVLDEEFGESQLFVLKDPRICRLAPFWLDVLKKAKIKPVIYMPTRNPLEVAGSLCRRNSIDPALGHLLWLRHVLDAELSTRGMSRFHCSYEGLLKEWPNLVAHSEKSLGISWPRMSASVQDEINSFLTKSLRHHEESVEAVYENPTYSPWLKQVFEIMGRWSENGESSNDYQQLDRIYAEMEAVAPAFVRLVSSAQDAVKQNKLIEKHEQQLEENLEHINQLEEDLAKKEEALAQKELEASNIENALEQQLEEVKDKLQSIGQQKALLDKKLGQSYSEIAILSGIIRERETELERHSWIRSILIHIFSIRPSAGFFVRVRALLLIPFQFAKIDAKLKRQGVFDPEKYLNLYPDVAEAKMDPLWHYLRYGIEEGRDSGTSNLNN